MRCRSLRTCAGWSRRGNVLAGEVLDQGFRISSLGRRHGREALELGAEDDARAADEVVERLLPRPNLAPGPACARRESQIASENMAVHALGEIVSPFQVRGGARPRCRLRLVKRIGPGPQLVAQRPSHTPRTLTRGPPVRGPSAVSRLEGPRIETGVPEPAGPSNEEPFGNAPTGDARSSRGPRIPSASGASRRRSTQPNRCRTFYCPRPREAQFLGPVQLLVPPDTGAWSADS